MKIILEWYLFLGWWFSNCLEANLNGRYSKSDALFSAKNDGIIWNDGSMSVDGRASPSRKEAEMEISRLDSDDNPEAEANLWV